MTESLYEFRRIEAEHKKLRASTFVRKSKLSDYSRWRFPEEELNKLKSFFLNYSGIASSFKASLVKYDDYTNKYKKTENQGSASQSSGSTGTSAVGMAAFDVDGVLKSYQNVSKYLNGINPEMEGGDAGSLTKIRDAASSMITLLESMKDYKARNNAAMFNAKVAEYTSKAQSFVPLYNAYNTKRGEALSRKKAEGTPVSGSEQGQEQMVAFNLESAQKSFNAVYDYLKNINPEAEGTDKDRHIIVLYSAKSVDDVLKKIKRFKDTGKVAEFNSAVTKDYSKAIRDFGKVYDVYNKKRAEELKSKTTQATEERTNFDVKAAQSWYAGLKSSLNRMNAAQMGLTGQAAADFEQLRGNLHTATDLVTNHLGTMMPNRNLDNATFNDKAQTYNKLVNENFSPAYSAFWQKYGSKMESW